METNYLSEAKQPDIDTINAIDDLHASVHALRHSGTASLDDESTAQKQKSVFDAIHRLCDLQGIGTEGAEADIRLAFAEHIHGTMIGNTSMSASIDIREIATQIKRYPRLQISDMERKSFYDGLLNKQPESNPINMPKQSTETDKNPIGPAESKRFSITGAMRKGVAWARSKRDHLIDRLPHVKPRKAVVALGATAMLAVIGMVPSSVAQESNKQAVPAQKISKTFESEQSITGTPKPTTTTSRPTTTMFVGPTEELVEPPSTTPPESLLQPEISTAAAVEAVTIAEGDNVWDGLEELGAGTSDADDNIALQQAIVRILPHVAQASGIMDLGEINPGTRIIISAEDVAKLRAAGSATIG
jgi:hypothetical protein